MKLLLTPEEKKTLRYISAYLKSYGTDEDSLVIEDIEAGHSDLSIINVTEWTEFNKSRVSIPERLYPILEKILKSNQKDFNEVDEDTDANINYGRLELNIDTIKKEISLNYEYYYYGTEDGTSTTYTNEDDDSINDILHEIEEIGDVLPIMELRYNGGGDSGYIESTFENGDSVPASVEDYCYRVLENMYGGWEINEGSQGTFYFDFRTKEITLEHQYNTEESDYVTLYKESFAV